MFLILATAGAARGQETTTKRNLLFIGQSKGYQHDSVSTAMATLYNLGRSSGRWNTFFRTDCTAITKKPLKWGAKNLNAFDAVVFFTDGDLDMDDSQKADLLSFVRDDGKGFIGIHSATITFVSWPEYGKMIGGYYDGHPWGVFDAPLVVEDAELSRHGASCRAASRSRTRSTSSRTSREPTFACCLRLDAGKIDLARKGVKRKDNDFAVMWARDVRQGTRALQRPGSSAGSLGAARDPEDVGRAGAMGHGARSRRCHAPRPAQQ